MEDLSRPLAPSHHDSDDQRPMSKQEEALGSAHLKRFSAAVINRPRRYLFPLPVIKTGRDIILIISSPISRAACLWLISISFVFHTVMLIQRDIKHRNGAELQRSGGFSSSALIASL